jgi:hypothetical protein
MQGGELPDVYIYAKPKITVAFKVLKRFVVVGQTIKFSVSNDGKDKNSIHRKSILCAGCTKPTCNR